MPGLKEESAIEIIRAAIDSGVNFIDIGYPLAKKNHGQPGDTLVKALADGYRQKVKLCGAVPAFMVNSPQDFEKALDILLNWLKADSVEFLMLGGLNRFTWPRLRELKITKSLEKALKEKKAEYTGFYFHDQYQFLRDIIQAWDNWTFCQCQYSFIDVDHHPGYGGIKLAADKGLAVVAVKPLLGGSLVKNIPETVARVWEKAEPERSAAEWALRWAWNHSEIATVICDLDSPVRVKEAAAIADKALPDTFDVMEELIIGKARDAYFALKPIPCTACRGCMPSGICPNGIDVPRVFEIYNDAVMYNDLETGRLIFATERHDLDACTECGTCVCGKQIPITDWLKKTKKILG